MKARRQARCAAALWTLLSACTAAPDSSESVALHASALRDGTPWLQHAATTRPAEPTRAGRHGRRASDYRAFAEAFDAERAEQGLPGAAVGVIEHGRLVFKHGSGVKGPDSTEPVEPDTLFRIGSMTKALTATALIAAADEQDVSLDEPVQQVLPDLPLEPTQYQSLTYAQLLSHQSGLTDYASVNGPHEDNGLTSFFYSDEFADNITFMVPPGTFFNYSNTNYSVLGLLLERLDGSSYRDAVQRRVLDPLGMQRTYFLAEDVLADGNYSAGTTTNAAGDMEAVEPDAYDNAWARPAGFAYSSVVDYAQYMEFLLRDVPRLLRRSSWRAQHTSQVLMREGSSRDGYGFGLTISEGLRINGELYDVPVVSHNGRINGFQSLFVLLPTEGFGVVMLGNSDTIALPGRSLVELLQRRVTLPEPGPIPADELVDPQLFPEFAGRYVGTVEGLELEITAVADALRVEIPAFDAQGIDYEKTLQPAGGNLFIATLTGSQVPVSFLKDETGTYVWLRTRTFVAKRESTP